MGRAAAPLPRAQLTVTFAPIPYARSGTGVALDEARIDHPESVPLRWYDRRVTDFRADADLRLLATKGLSSLPPARLPEVAERWWQDGERTGDPRSLILARIAWMLEAWWEQTAGESDAALPTLLVDELDGILAQDLPKLLETDGAGGLGLARDLRARLEGVLQNWAGWQRWYVTPLGSR
jgi:hypothetical protein